MLKKYLQFLIDSFEKLTSLGGSNSTWSDYFLTVGNEILVILIGLAYIVSIFLIIYIPIFGNKKLIRGIRKKDKWYRFYSLYEKYTEAVLKIRSIVSNIEQNEDVRILNEYAYNDHLVKELIETLNKFGIQIPGVNFKKGDKFDKELLNNTLKEFNLQSRLPMEEIPKHKWDNCGDFTEFNIFGESWNKERHVTTLSALHHVPDCYLFMQSLLFRLFLCCLSRIFIRFITIRRFYPVGAV